MRIMEEDNLVKKTVKEYMSYIDSKFRKNIHENADLRIAKLFGARYYFRMDWNLGKLPSYTEKEISDTLIDAGIDVDPKVLLDETLEVSPRKDSYVFKKTNEGKYELTYKRANQKRD